MAEAVLDDKGTPGYSKVDLPRGFKDEDAFIKWIRETYEADLSADDANRRAAMEDSEFMAGEQWDELDKKFRIEKKLPVLTVNQLPAFVGTIIGNRRLNEVTVKVEPDSGASRGIANLREGITRSILKNSVAKRAFDKAFENQVICGIGNFGLSMEYTNNDVFDQDICIHMIPHALSVVWDKNAYDPTGRDAHHVFVAEMISEAEHDDRWPDADGSQFGGEVDQWCRDNGWISGTDRRVVTVWRMSTRPKTLAMMNDGTVQDVTGKDPASFAMNVVRNPKTGQVMVREAEALVAQRYVTNGKQILEGPYELPIDRVPIFRMTGWEINIGPRRVRWGLIRLAKDAQRLFNFWRSVVAEKLLYAPKAIVMGPQSAFEGRLDAWADMHTTREPLVYNDEAGEKPEFVQPPTPDLALLQQASMALQDMRDVLNLHEASLGLQSNEVSARAITARQKLGEMGTVIYNDNANDAVEECGRVINQLIPVCYDTPRIIKTVGADDKEVMAAINQGTADTDVTLGQYSVTLSTGPSYVTKRAEAAEAMLNFVNAAPQTAAVAADLIVDAQDWPNAGAIAARFRKALPPGLIDPGDMTPEQQQSQQQQALLGQAKTKLELEGMQAENDKNKAAAEHSRAMAGEASARAVHAKAQAAAALKNADTSEMKVVSGHINDEQNRLAELYKNEADNTAEFERDRANHERIMEQNAAKPKE